MNLTKDYQLIAGVLYKFNVNEKKHLLWKEGGIPLINANLWDFYETIIRSIMIRTNKSRTFTISHDDFEKNMREVQFGKYERQYLVPKEYWTITAPDDNQQKLPL